MHGAVQVEACTLSANFKRYSQRSASGDEVVLTRTGFLELMHSLGVGDDKVRGRMQSLATSRGLTAAFVKGPVVGCLCRVS